MRYYQWLYYNEEEDLGPIKHYILNLPIEDPVDESEMGFYVVTYSTLEEEIDRMEFSWNNAPINEIISDDEYQPLTDKSRLSLLWHQAGKIGKEAIKSIFEDGPSGNFK